MKVVYSFPSDMKRDIEQIVKSDEIVNRGSILFREGSAYGHNGEYLLVYDGDDERVSRLGELMNGKAERPSDEDDIIRKIAEEEDRSLAGFGGIF